MTNKEILKKAYKKVIQNGYVDYAGIKDSVDDIYAEKDIRFIRFAERAIVMDHDFVKALWGNQPSCGNPLCETCPGVWQHRIQDMVVKENPVQYLAKFL